MIAGYRRVATVIVFGAVTAGTTGCAALEPCDRSDNSHPAEEYRQGTTVGGYYMSSPWNGPLLAFSGAQRYRMFHNLGQVPRDIHCWVSFQARGTDDGSIAEAAGNLCIVQEITDQYIQIKNDTCSDMYVLVTASAPKD